ncbi:hypothetical protein ABZY09_30730 [Streptomyces sp. NPDC002928]|uniref:hypothetical protein n=1 Tax=Streptomyces sp. NPDC002928 TaxID=3154440 RepID=UPI0033BA152B
MTVSRQKRKAWEMKFSELAPAARKAAEDLLVAIHNADEDGVSHADIARMIGDKSRSGIAAKATKGRLVLARRQRRGPQTS